MRTVASYLETFLMKGRASTSSYFNGLGIQLWYPQLSIPTGHPKISIVLTPPIAQVDKHGFLGSKLETYVTVLLRVSADESLPLAVADFYATSDPANLGFRSWSSSPARRFNSYFSAAGCKLELTITSFGRHIEATAASTFTALAPAQCRSDRRTA
jgi:hypothetical protein